MKTISLAILLVTIFSSASVAQQSSNQSRLNDSDFMKGVELGSKHEYNEALKYLKKAELRFPKDIAVKENIMVCFWNLQQYEKAIGVISDVISLAPSDFSKYDSRAKLLIGLGDFRKAISDLDKAIELSHSNEGSVFFSRGEANKYLGNYASALEDLNRALELIKDKELILATYRVRGEVLNNLKEYDQAILDFNKYFSLGGKKVIVNFYLGEAYFNRYWENKDKGNLDKAIPYLEKYAKTRNPDNAVYRHLGIIYCEQKDKFHSRYNFDLATLSNPKDAQAWFQYGCMELITGNSSKGRELIEKALTFETFKEKAKAYFNLGLEDFVEKDSVKGFTNFQKAIAIDSTLTEVYQARIYFQIRNIKKNYKSVINDVTKLSTLAKESKQRANAIYLAAQIEILNRAPGIGLKLIENAIELDSTNANFYVQRALTKLSLDEKDKKAVLIDIDKAISMDSNCGAALAIKAGLYVEEKDYIKACELLQKAIHLGVNASLDCTKLICAGKPCELKFDLASSLPKPLLLY